MNDPIEPAPEGSGDAPPPGPSDPELVSAALAGDEDAFARLVRRHQGRAWRVARNLVPSAEDASDLTQEAFLRVFKSLERYNPEYEFKTWLYRIVTNLCIDHLRKRRPTTSTSAPEDDGELDLLDEDAPAPSEGLEREETRVRVRDVIDSLAPHFRTVLALRELEGLSCGEIAGIVGATPVTVRWRLHRGRKLFQEEWERRERIAAAGPGASDFIGANDQDGSDVGKDAPAARRRATPKRDQP
jgi:RNA polymerase sigma-70 factor (ECF subfamily)